MTVKFLHLNIFKGKFIDRIIDFIKDKDIDILNFQEVTGGEESFGNIDSFEFLKKSLSHQGEMVTTWNAYQQPNIYFGNATFFKKDFKLNKKESIYLKPHTEIKDHKNRNIADDPRALLTLNINLKGKNIEIVNAHLAWGPTPKDKPYKLEQGQKLVNYIASLKGPFILSGDFNLDPTSLIVSSLQEIARNLTAENNITNTLNPRVHYGKELFPKGIAVDYLFVEKSIKVNRFERIDKLDLSDHFGLLLEFTI